MTKNEIVAGVQLMVNTLYAQRRELEAKARKEQHELWLAQGGCDRCGGRGWVVVWDTLDSLSGCYAEYGECPERANHQPGGKATGADPGYYDSKYDRLRWHTDSFVPPAELVALDKELKDWQRTLEEAREEARVEKGKIIMVVRGRKVPVGTQGECIWLGSGGGNGRGVSFGDRVGLKDSSGTVYWTSASNVEVV